MQSYINEQGTYSQKQIKTVIDNSSQNQFKNLIAMIKKDKYFALSFLGKVYKILWKLQQAKIVEPDSKLRRRIILSGLLIVKYFKQQKCQDHIFNLEMN